MLRFINLIKIFLRDRHTERQRDRNRDREIDIQRDGDVYSLRDTATEMEKEGKRKREKGNTYRDSESPHLQTEKDRHIEI